MDHSKTSSHSTGSNQKKDIIKELVCIMVGIILVTLVAELALRLIHGNDTRLRAQAVNADYAPFSITRFLIGTVVMTIPWIILTFPLMIMKYLDRPARFSLLVPFVVVGLFACIQFLEVWVSRSLTTYDDFEKFEFYGLWTIWLPLFLAVPSYLVACCVVLWRINKK